MVLAFKDSIVTVAANRLRVMLRKVLLLLPTMAMMLVARISRDGDEYDVGVEVQLALTSSAGSAAGAANAALTSSSTARALRSAIHHVIIMSSSLISSSSKNGLRGLQWRLLQLLSTGSSVRDAFVLHRSEPRHGRLHHTR